MTVLGIDYGAKKIGLAKSDSQNKMAFPLEILINTGRPEILKRIKEVCQENEIEKIIVGVPTSFSPKKKEGILRPVDLENQQMKTVLGFISWLKTNVDLPVDVEDERLSTKLANGLRKDLVKKGPDDAVAAMLILQTYLDKLNFKF
ncbi:MAG: Holliday junction resolvase RuvX [Candidatus Buchananbacteria bacterium]